MVQQYDYILWANCSRLHDRGVEPAHAPMGRTNIPGLHGFVVDLALYAGSIHIESRTGGARFCEFNDGFSHSVALIGPELLVVNSFRRQVFPQRSREDRPAGGGESVDYFLRNQKYRLARASVELWVSDGIAFDSQRRKESFFDWALGNAAAGNVDL